MEYGSATLENIAEYDMLISQIFGSEEEGYNYYNAYARSKGFGVRKEELTTEPLEKSAALIYTRVMFKKVKQQIEQLSKWEVAEVTKNDDVVLYTVARKESRHVTYDVRCCVSTRWTMVGKSAFDSERNGNVHDWSEQMDRYHELRNICSMYLFKASNSPEMSQKVVAFLKVITEVDYAGTPEKVQQHFQACGTVNRVTILTDKFGQPKGFAHVEFLEQEAVQKAPMPVAILRNNLAAPASVTLFG
ncbi:polyadenylate-binding protein 2-like [Hordeum vulgare]|nr:polyadenylate-binding protein 2-like [Hordeum vulgare]